MDRKLENIPIGEISRKAVDISFLACKQPNHNTTISIAQGFTDAALTSLFKSFESRYDKPARMCVVHPDMLIFLDSFEDIVYREDQWHTRPPIATAGKLFVRGQVEKVYVIVDSNMPVSTAVIFNDTNHMTLFAHPMARYQKHNMDTACCRPTGHCKYCGLNMTGTDWGKDCPKSPMTLDGKELKETPVEMKDTFNFEKMYAAAIQAKEVHKWGWTANRQGHVFRPHGANDLLIAWADIDVADYLVQFEPMVTLALMDMNKALQEDLDDRDARVALANKACEEMYQQVAILEARLANANARLAHDPMTEDDWYHPPMDDDPFALADAEEEEGCLITELEASALNDTAEYWSLFFNGRVTPFKSFVALIKHINGTILHGKYASVAISNDKGKTWKDYARFERLVEACTKGTRIDLGDIYNQSADATVTPVPPQTDKERADQHFKEHLVNASALVATWPKWKREALGGIATSQDWDKFNKSLKDTPSDPVLEKMEQQSRDSWKIRHYGITYNFHYGKEMVSWVTGRRSTEDVEVRKGDFANTPWMSFDSFYENLKATGKADNDSFDLAYETALTMEGYKAQKAAIAYVENPPEATEDLSAAHWKECEGNLLTTLAYYENKLKICKPGTAPHDEKMAAMVKEALVIVRKKYAEAYALERFSAADVARLGKQDAGLPPDPTSHWQLKVPNFEGRTLYYNFYHFDPLLTWVHNNRNKPTAISNDGGMTWKDYTSFQIMMQEDNVSPATAFRWASDVGETTKSFDHAANLSVNLKVTRLEKDLAEAVARQQHYLTACQKMEAEGCEVLGRLLGMVLTAKEQPELIGAKPGDVFVGIDTLGSLLDQVEDTFTWRDSEKELPNPEHEVIVKAGAFTHVCQVVLNDGSIKKHPTQGKKFQGPYWLHGGTPFSVINTRWMPMPEWVELCPHSGQKVLLHPVYGPICDSQGCPCKG